MENRFEHNEPESQTWKAYLPPLTPGLQSEVQKQDVRQDTLCAWVCEKLSDLLDNDGSVRPEQKAGIYGHLAVCRGCAQEFDEMQRVVAFVEHLPPVELPRDFSGQIMQRIVSQNAPVMDRALASLPETSAVLPAKTQAATQLRSKVTATQSAEQKAALHVQQQLTQTETQQTQSQLLQRLTAGSGLSAVMGYFLSTAWGRQMLGVLPTAVSAWLGQAGDVLRGVPVLTWIVGLIFSALAQLNAMLGQTYHVMGTAAAVGITLDVAICALAYVYLSAQRHSAQLRL